MPKWLIHPFHPYFRMFLYLTVVMAGLTGLITPWVIAFQEVPGLWCADPPVHNPVFRLSEGHEHGHSRSGCASGLGLGGLRAWTGFGSEVGQG